MCVSRDKQRGRQAERQAAGMASERIISDGLGSTVLGSSGAPPKT